MKNSFTNDFFYLFSKLRSWKYYPLLERMAFIILCLLCLHFSSRASNSSCKADTLSCSNLSNEGELEVLISIWVDKSGSANGIVPELHFEQLQPILDIYQELDAATMSIGKIGSFTRQDMAFFSFRNSNSIQLPERKHGQTPTEYQKELLRYKKRKSRKKAIEVDMEGKLLKFEAAARPILEAARSESHSLICEGLNVSKRQAAQSNVSKSTQKYILVLSDMRNNGLESCPLSMGDAELIIVNRLSNPSKLLLHGNTSHFISVEEAIDYITSKI